jgi:hypothetical protein
MLEIENVQFFSFCAVNGLGSIKKRSGCTEITSKLCNKENRIAAMKMKPSAVCQSGGYNSNKGQTLMFPVVPQLRTSKPSTHILTPISKHCKHPVTKQGKS